MRLRVSPPIAAEEEGDEDIGVAMCSEPNHRHTWLISVSLTLLYLMGIYGNVTNEC